MALAWLSRLAPSQTRSLEWQSGISTRAAERCQQQRTREPESQCARSPVCRQHLSARAPKNQSAVSAPARERKSTLAVALWPAGAVLLLRGWPLGWWPRCAVARYAVASARSGLAGAVVWAVATRRGGACCGLTRERGGAFCVGAACRWFPCAALWLPGMVPAAVWCARMVSVGRGARLAVARWRYAGWAWLS